MHSLLSSHRSSQWRHSMKWSVATPLCCGVSRAVMWLRCHFLVQSGAAVCLQSESATTTTTRTYIYIYIYIYIIEARWWSTVQSWCWPWPSGSVCMNGCIFNRRWNFYKALYCRRRGLVSGSGYVLEHLPSEPKLKRDTFIVTLARVTRCTCIIFL